MTCKREELPLIWGFADSVSPLWLSPVIPAEVDRITTRHSHCWSVYSRINANIAWNFWWGSACRYCRNFSLFCLTPMLNWHLLSQWEFALLLQKQKFTWHATEWSQMKHSDSFHWCCHPVDTIFHGTQVSSIQFDNKLVLRESSQWKSKPVLRRCKTEPNYHHWHPVPVAWIFWQISQIWWGINLIS